MPELSAARVRAVGYRFALAGTATVAAILLLPLVAAGVYDTAASVMGVLVPSAAALFCFVGTVLPALVRRGVLSGAFASAGFGAASYLVALSVGLLVNFVVSPRPGEPEPFRDYVIKPAFWFLLVGVPLSLAFGAPLDRALRKIRA